MDSGYTLFTAVNYLICRPEAWVWGHFNLLLRLYSCTTRTLLYKLLYYYNVTSKDLYTVNIMYFSLTGQCYRCICAYHCLVFLLSHDQFFYLYFSWLRVDLFSLLVLRSACYVNTLTWMYSAGTSILQWYIVYFRKIPFFSGLISSSACFVFTLYFITYSSLT